MLLERLVELYDRVKGEMCSPRHVVKELSWIIELTSEGEFLGIISTDREIPVADLYTAGQGTTPRLLVGKASYVLGLDIKDEGEEKILPFHESFVSLLQECEEEIGGEDLRAVRTFLEDKEQMSAISQPEDMGYYDFLTFSVEGRLPSLSSDVQEFWKVRMREKAVEDSSLQGRCMACGEYDQPIARIHREKIPIGGGVKLVSADKPAFESYGMKKAETAPICIRCSEIYTRVLGYLACSEEHSIYIHPTTHIFWTREPDRFDPQDCLTNPNPEGVGDLMKSAFQARGAPKTDENGFYVLSVSTRKLRLVVRNWLQTTVRDARESLANYFRMQRMVGPDGDNSFYALKALARSLGRRKANGRVDYKTVPVQVEDALLACAIEGTPMPTQILHQAVQRIRKDSKNRMTRPRAALMRLVFESQRSHGLTTEDDEVTDNLNTENSSPAYLCGRLLAVLENIQKAAVPGIKATLVDRYFGAASSAPATVFGALLRSAQNHMAKLRKSKDKKGAYYNLDSRLQEICSQLPPAELPNTLSLREQALFSLGYYQQRADDGRQAKENAEKKDDKTTGAKEAENDV